MIPGPADATHTATWTFVMSGLCGPFGILCLSWWLFLCSLLTCPTKLLISSLCTPQSFDGLADHLLVHLLNTKADMQEPNIFLFPLAIPSPLLAFLIFDSFTPHPPPLSLSHCAGGCTLVAMTACSCVVSELVHVVDQGFQKVCQQYHMWYVGEMLRIKLRTLHRQRVT